MTINTNSYKEVYNGKQRLVVYSNGNIPYVPLTNVVLAPSTDTLRPLYNAGRIMAIYGSDAPNAAYEGMAVNFDPASAVTSQTIPVGVLADPFAQDLTGIDLTSATTATATINRVNISKFLVGGSLYWYNTLLQENSTAVMTGFNAYFVTDVVTQAYLGTTQSNIIAIQGVV